VPSAPVPRMKRCWMFGRPERVIAPASAATFGRSAPLSTAIVLPETIVNCQHVTAFAVIEFVPDQSAVMDWPLAKAFEILEYQMETVTPPAAAALLFVYSRAFVQVLPAVSVMAKWSLVFPSVVARLSVARTMTPRLFRLSAAEVVNAHVWELVLLFAVQKEPTLPKAPDSAAMALVGSGVTYWRTFHQSYFCHIVEPVPASAKA